MRRVTISLVAMALLASFAHAAAAKPRVSMELATQSGLAPTDAQEWYKLLTSLGVSGLRIRAAAPRDEPAIAEQGTKDAPSYKVTGLLSAGNVLRLPGGEFRLHDSAKLRAWLDDLAEQGVEGLTQPKGAFGLTPSQLEQVAADLKRPVTFSTAGQSAASAVDRLGNALKFPLALDAASRRALAGVTLEEELRGLSAGTALAIMLRPAGLALVPSRAAGAQLQYQAARTKSVSRSWPIGWQPKARADKVLPALFEFLNVEITEVPVSDALSAIQGRLKVPMLFDRNAMALHGIDPARQPAEVASRRMTYSHALRHVLAQARLKYELRVDEAEQPFIWITTIQSGP